MGFFNLFHTRRQGAPVSIVDLTPRGDSYVRIDGRDHAISSWNPQGFHLSPYNGGLIAGQIARVQVNIHDYHDRDPALRIEDQVRIESIDGAGLRARWWRLPRQKKAEITRYFVRKLEQRE